MDNQEIIKEIDESISLINETKTTVNNALSHARTALEREDKLIKEAYDKGLKDAWELARRLTAAQCDGGFSEGEVARVFGTPLVRVVFKCNSYEVALAKIEDHEKAQSEIKVGDEVAILGSAVKGYVISKSEEGEGHCTVLITNYKGFRVASYAKSAVRKTGKYVDIQSMLDQSGGEHSNE